MVNFVKKRLQVFVSSTYTDLIEERQAAVEAILTAGHIPAGMELFTSGDESQLEVIYQWIDESDIYLLILGGRYGSVDPKTGKSYTHLEYEYALSKGKPSFACVITDKAINKKVAIQGRKAIENENPKELKDFRSFTFTKVHKPWDDYKDIKIIVSESLANFARHDDLIGWVRASEEADIPALADEIARLSKENAQLRSQIDRNGTEDTINGLSFDELKSTLEREDLLNFLEEKKSILGVGNTASKIIGAVTMGTKETMKQKLDSLCGIGLVSSHRYSGTSSNYVIFQLSNDGRSFLNKLDLCKLKQQSADSTQEIAV